MLKIKLSYINDPGHGWLSVSLDMLRRLKIVDRITFWSYMTPTRGYLEEDCDAPVLVEALKSAGYIVSFADRYADRVALRYYGCYNPHFVHHPIKQHSTQLLIDYSFSPARLLPCVVLEANRHDGFVVQRRDGVKWRLPYNSATNYLLGPGQCLTCPACDGAIHPARGGIYVREDDAKRPCCSEPCVELYKQRLIKQAAKVA